MASHWSNGTITLGWMDENEHFNLHDNYLCLILVQVVLLLVISSIHWVEYHVQQKSYHFKTCWNFQRVCFWNTFWDIQKYFICGSEIFKNKIIIWKSPNELLFNYGNYWHFSFKGGGGDFDKPTIFGSWILLNLIRKNHHSFCIFL